MPKLLYFYCVILLLFVACASGGKDETPAAAPAKSHALQRNLVDKEGEPWHIELDMDCPTDDNELRTAIMDKLVAIFCDTLSDDNARLLNLFLAKNDSAALSSLYSSLCTPTGKPVSGLGSSYEELCGYVEKKKMSADHINTVEVQVREFYDGPSMACYVFNVTSTLRSPFAALEAYSTTLNYDKAAMRALLDRELVDYTCARAVIRTAAALLSQDFPLDDDVISGKNFCYALSPDTIIVYPAPDATLLSALTLPVDRFPGICAALSPKARKLLADEGELPATGSAAAKTKNAVSFLKEYYAARLYPPVGADLVSARTKANTYIAGVYPVTDEWYAVDYADRWMFCTVAVKVAFSGRKPKVASTIDISDEFSFYTLSHGQIFRDEALVSKY